MHRLFLVIRKQVNGYFPKLHAFCVYLNYLVGRSYTCYGKIKEIIKVSP